MTLFRSRLFLPVMAVISLSISHAYALKTLVIMTNDNQQISGSLRLVSSTPYDRQTLDKAPQSVSFTFSQTIKPDKSFIRVYDAFGNRLETGDLEAHDMSISVTLPELTGGKYSIKWKARCRCDDDTEISDNFHFTIK